MAPLNLTSVQNGWNAIWTIDNRGKSGDKHTVLKDKPFTGNVQLSNNEVRFSFKGNDPDGIGYNDTEKHIFSLVYKGNDDLEIWWEGKSEKNEKIAISGASKVLLNIENSVSGVLGVILLDGSGNNKFWKNYYEIAKKV